jgi:aryl-alcohol dehydrogenase-like predicted oxidoreductase
MDDSASTDVPFTHDPWCAARARYNAMPYRRVGDPGLLLPAISLGLWYNFGEKQHGCDRVHCTDARAADRPLPAKPADEVSRAARPTLDPAVVTATVRQQLQGLARIAERRGQSLAQMALAWVLRNSTVASTLVGASSVLQLRENLGALENLHFTSEELAEIDRHTAGPPIDL